MNRSSLGKISSKIKNIFSQEKRICCMLFKKKNFALQKTPVILHVHLYGDTKGNRELVHIQEGEEDFVLAHPEQQVLIRPAEGDLKITLYVKETVIGRPAVVSIDKLMSGARICEPFVLDFTDQPHIVVVSLRIGQNERLEDELLFPLDFSTPHRRERAFSQYPGNTDNNEGNDGQLSAPPEILARGPRAQQAYVEAAKAGTKKVFRTRLMLVGQERVGKTSLKKTLTGQGFDKNEAITDGVETTNVCEINIEVAKAGEKMWSIHKKGHGNEDKKGDAYSKSIVDEIVERLIVTPPQDQESLEPSSDATLIRGLSPEEAADKLAKRLTVTPPQDQESLEPHSDTTPGNYLDHVEADESVEEVDNIPYQISSLLEKRLKEQVQLKEKGTDRTDSGRVEGVSLSIWDFAGQDLYYTTHQVFLTWRAIYVIVYDLRSLCPDVPPDEMAKGGAKSELKCLEFINFWLRSIFAHAVAPSAVNKKTSKTADTTPPIFIVGTHRGSVKGDGKIASAIEKIRESVERKPFECQVIPKYYAIENSLEDKDEELITLRRDIKKVAMDEPYMKDDIPLRWLFFEENLAADKNYMSLDQTKELMRQVGITSESDLFPMLTFYHDLGYIVYYGGIEDQKSLPQDMDDQKSLLRDMEDQKSLPQDMEDQKSLPQDMEDQKSLPQDMEDQKSLLQDMEYQKSLLRDMVILNPQWLIDVFKQVITIMDPNFMDGADRFVNDARSTLKKDGILEDRLIQHMWQGFSDQKDTLVQLMAKFDLICEVPGGLSLAADAHLEVHLQDLSLQTSILTPILILRQMHAHCWNQMNLSVDPLRYKLQQMSANIENVKILSLYQREAIHLACIK